MALLFTRWLIVPALRVSPLSQKAMVFIILWDDFIDCNFVLIYSATYVGVKRAIFDYLFFLFWHMWLHPLGSRDGNVINFTIQILLTLDMLQIKYDNDWPCRFQEEDRENVKLWTTTHDDARSLFTLGYLLMLLTKCSVIKI